MVETKEQEALASVEVVQNGAQVAVEMVDQEAQSHGAKLADCMIQTEVRELVLETNILGTFEIMKDVFNSSFRAKQVSDSRCC